MAKEWRKGFMLFTLNKKKENDFHVIHLQSQM